MSIKPVPFALVICDQPDSHMVTPRKWHEVQILNQAFCSSGSPSLTLVNDELEWWPCAWLYVACRPCPPNHPELLDRTCFSHSSIEKCNLMHLSFFLIAAIDPGMILRVILISILALGILTLMINRLIAIWNRIWPVTTVFENYQALHFHRGRFVAQLPPGEYRFRKSTNQLDLYDMRESPLIVSGQEVLTSDHLGLKLSLVVQWRFADLLKVRSVVSSYHNSLHSDIQATCRQAVETRTCEELLGNRSVISTEVLENLRVKADRYGIEIVDVSIRDFMLPASLKAIYSKVAEARQEGLAALERARGETAALRSLANASRMIASTPGLALLRTLQTLENASGNSTVVLPAEFLKLLNSSTTDAPDNTDKNSGNS